MNIGINKHYFNQKIVYKYFNTEYFELIIYSLLAFGLPFIIAHPQWLIGILVNFFLIRGAIYFKFKNIIPIIFIPSIGVLSAGIIFGVNTHYLLYFIPIIWASNLLFILGYKYLRFNRHQNIWITPLVISIFKAMILFCFAVIVVYLFDFPKLFLISMGLVQLTTAAMGAYLAVISSKFT